MSEPLEYANVACVVCGETYWFGPMSNPDIEDWGITASCDVCPTCGSDQRRPWPKISMRPVVRDEEPNE